MAHIRTYKEVLELEPTEAEQQLIECAKAGEVCVLNGGQLPSLDQHRECEIRADILRYILMGGSDECLIESKRIRLEGAFISGVLNVAYANTSAFVSLIACKFQRSVYLHQSKFNMLNLSESNLPGLSAEAIRVAHNLILNEAAVTGKIDISSSTIGGQLSLVGAQLQAEEGYALNAHSAQISGGIFFHPMTPQAQKEVLKVFDAKGGINLTAATVGHFYAESVTVKANSDANAVGAINLTVNGIARLNNCEMTGPVDFTGAKITGDLSCKGSTFDTPNSDAFIARRMQVAQSFIWRKDANATGSVILDGAHVAELDDNPSSWPGKDQLSLDGFTYNRITEYTKYDAARRQWLRDGSLVGGKFFPQPYTQYAKFLRDTGHDAQARQVLLTRERMVRYYQRPEFNPLHRAWRYFWDGLQLVVVGHGHAPFWSLGWLALLIFLATIPAHHAWEEGSFAPNSGPIIVSEGWQNLHTTEGNPAKVWSGDAAQTGWSPPETDTTDWDQDTFDEAWKSVAPGRDWETFNRYAYGADIVIPLINFGQTEAWAPSTTRGPWGWHLWWLRWVFTVFGWIVTALGAAAITGIIRRD
ncbi:MAG: hypothetical protein WA790_20065 [Sulfitobacter sp.]